MMNFEDRLHYRYTNRIWRSIPRRCFTLPELMVAMAITVVISFFFMKIIDTIGKTINRSHQRMNTTSRACFVFNRLDQDFMKMPKRLDMGYVMTNASTEENFLRFVSQVKGVGGDRGVSLVGYKLNTGSEGLFGLYRGAHGYRWEDRGFMGMNQEGVPPNLLGLSDDLMIQDEDYELLAPGVFRVGMVFQLRNTGKYVSDAPLVILGTNQSQKFLQITNIASVVVCMALMDVNPQLKITPSQLEQLSARFTEVPEGLTPLSHWQTNLEYQYAQFSEGIPGEVAKSIRVYQRFFPLD